MQHLSGGIGRILRGGTPGNVFNCQRSSSSSLPTFCTCSSFSMLSMSDWIFASFRSSSRFCASSIFSCTTLNCRFISTRVRITAIRCVTMLSTPRSSILLSRSPRSSISFALISCSCRTSRADSANLSRTSWSRNFPFSAFSVGTSHFHKKNARFFQRASDTPSSNWYRARIATDFSRVRFLSPLYCLAIFFAFSFSFASPSSSSAFCLCSSSFSRITVPDFSSNSASLRFVVSSYRTRKNRL
mmetsp:Transcript_23190/g.58582  ORF Transcript_23190/g.58582 Transcript_23190/m.58582 type:complete len:243 (-) Transcript_23190:710-1438(-)